MDDARPEWDPEIDVSAASAAELFGGRFAHVAPLATGWDNTVFLADGTWVLRFPRRRIAVPGVEREIALLPGLSAALPLPVPVPEIVGRPSDAFPWPFWGARLLPGRELAESGLPDALRTSAAAALGAFLRALHAPDLAASLGARLPVDPFRRGDPSVRAPMAREKLDGLVARGLYEPDAAVAELLAAGARSGPSGARLVVAHGDLHVRHLLVGPDGRAAGVIDWGDLCRADPAVDLSLAYAGFQGAARDALLAAYGPVSPATELRARVAAAFLCSTLAEYAAATGRARLRDESLAGLRRCVS
ncbi:phosphotransferase [Actinomadura rubteroloni]|nr:phosphotransferase [Actinomadura rubteroloni]